MKSLKGKTAIVTGASRGLGVVIAEALAREGVNLILTARSEAPLREVAARLSRLGVDARVVAADVADARGREQIIAAARDELGPIDILVNNAGIEAIGRYEATDPETIEKLVLVNVVAPMLLTRALLPEMLARRSGQIVTISSLAAKKGLPYNSVYAATKAAATSWAWGLREELHGTGVRSSVISPGFISDSGMFSEYDTKAHWVAGESKPESVGEAVVAALTRDKAELIVSPGPIKLMLLLDAMSPSLTSWFFRRIGLYQFYRKLAELVEARPD